MATKYIDIYIKALYDFKSPTISRLQDADFQAFCMLMYGYLEKSITLCNVNVAFSQKLSLRTEPVYEERTFTSDGISGDFELTAPNLPIEDLAIFSVLVDGQKTDEYSYDYTSLVLSLSSVPLLNKKVEISWYNSGDFSKNLTIDEKNLLAYGLTLSWARQVSNDELDIRRSLADTDFKVHSEATTTNAKANWVKEYEEFFKRELSKFDWRSKFL